MKLNKVDFLHRSFVFLYMDSPFEILNFLLT